jgi:hypothetical protein
VCHAVRAPGSKVTAAPAARAGAGAVKSGSMRTVPVNQSAGPLPDGFVPARAMSMSISYMCGRSPPKSTLTKAAPLTGATAVMLRNQARAGMSIYLTRLHAL